MTSPTFAPEGVVIVGRAIDRFFARGTPRVMLIDEYDGPFGRRLPRRAEALVQRLPVLDG